MLGVTVFGLIFTPVFYVVVALDLGGGGFALPAAARRNRPSAGELKRTARKHGTMKFGVGQAVVRKEDDPLMRGAGRYVAGLAAGRARCTRVVRALAACACALQRLRV